MQKSIEILGQEYSVSIVNYCDLSDEDETVHGLIDFDAKRIYIDSLAIDEKKSLLHEVIHGILFESGLSNLLESSLEEAIVVALENGLWNAGYTRAIRCDRQSE